ncbi:reverse transcriptase domain, reverse transcriptase zinc-binding domain protein, partial [Tanacetum coccineum]
CKEARVADRGVWVNGVWTWIWDWVRDPRGRGCGDLEQMLRILNDINLSLDCRDCWRWTLSEDNMFTVKSLARVVDEKRLQSDQLGQETVWNKLAPKKVNVFVWRVLKGRLPVLTELDKRGIDLHTLLCPCGNNVETINHAMLLCDMAWRVWEKFFNWWKFDRVDVFTISELFRHNGSGSQTKEIKSLWQVVIWVTGYFLWKERNNQVFCDKIASTNKIFQEIQLKSFQWVSRRSNKYSWCWQQWLREPFKCKSNIAAVK